jgi:prolyl-tRNA editing enzyme YbaK/EbsC (Cys-tRNA(Pro) deacylase)
MLDAVVHYLHEAGVPFRLTSYPAPEPEPAVAYRPPPRVQLIDTRLVLIDDRPALAVTIGGETVSMAALATETGALVIESSSESLGGDYRGTAGPVPPLGRLLGVPLFVDVRVAEAPMLAFRAFGPNDYLEIAYDDFALVEQPRVAAFGEAGELPPHRD